MGKFVRGVCSRGAEYVDHYYLISSKALQLAIPQDPTAWAVVLLVSTVSAPSSERREAESNFSSEIPNVASQHLILAMLGFRLRLPVSF